MIASLNASVSKSETSFLDTILFLSSAWTIFITSAYSNTFSRVNSMHVLPNSFTEYNGLALVSPLKIDTLTDI